MSNLILVRHGQSLWNKEKRFTGWVDVDLSEKGILRFRVFFIYLINCFMGGRRARSIAPTFMSVDMVVEIWLIKVVN